jgi:DNA-binding GntR family transcriptional regulator
VSKTYSSAELAYREVKERILSCALPGGELISEGEIAAQLGVSRTPVREAFLRLETEGWMRLYPKRGALIVPIADGEAEDVIEARFLIETHSARVATTPPQVRARLVTDLNHSLDQQAQLRDAADVPGFSAVDADFHRAIVAAGRNPLLMNFYDGLRDRQRRMTSHSISRDPSQLDSIVDDHRGLADCLAHGDVHAFAAALWAHMRTVHGLPPTAIPGEAP